MQEIYTKDVSGAKKEKKDHDFISYLEFNYLLSGKVFVLKM